MSPSWLYIRPTTYLSLWFDGHLKRSVEIELNLSCNLALDVSSLAAISASVLLRQLADVKPVPTNYSPTIGNQSDCSARLVDFPPSKNIYSIYCPVYKRLTYELLWQVKYMHDSWSIHNRLLCIQYAICIVQQSFGHKHGDNSHKYSR